MTGPHSYRGRAGCYVIRTARSTGLEVGVYRAAEAGIDAGAKWATVCEPHGTILGHETRRLARDAGSTPEDWCESCREIIRLAEAWAGQQLIRE